MAGPITIADQLVTIKSALQPFINQLDSGNAFICSDLAHLWSKLWDKSTSTKILIMYAGEDIRGPFGTAAVLGRVDRRFIVVVSRGRGINVSDRGALLYETVGNAPPLFDVVEQVRDQCRVLTFDADWCENPVDYKGVLLFATPPGLIIDAMQIEFSVGTQLPMVASTPR